MLRKCLVERFPWKLSGSAAASLVGIAAIGLGGCSADVLRFDAPVLGYKETDRTRTQEPVIRDKSLFDQRPPASGIGARPRTEPYRPPSASTGNVTKSELPDVPRTATKPTWSRPERREPDRTALLPPSRTEPRQYAQQPRAQSDDTVTVQRGDTLYDIARRYGLTVADLKIANGLTGNTIRPGQQLSLRVAPSRYQAERREPQWNRTPDRTSRPTPRRVASGGATYTIRPGDSLYGISRRTGVTVADLKAHNGIADVRRLRPGQVLQLPGGNQDNDTRTARWGGSPRLEPRRTARVHETRPREDVEPPRLEPRSNARRPRLLNDRSDQNAVTGTRRVRSVPIKVTEDPPPARVAARTDPQATTSDAAPPPRTVTSGKFRWPARGRIVSRYGVRGDGTKNDGIDIAVPIGTGVHAAETGVVAYAGSELAGYGNLVLVRHEGGWVTAYAHNDQLLVKRGDLVKRGQVIAKAGNTGTVKQPTVHFELRKGSKPVNPLEHLDRL